MTYRFCGVHACCMSEFNEVDEPEYNMIAEASSLQLSPGTFPRALNIDGEIFYVYSWDKDAVNYRHENGSKVTVLN